MINDNKTERLLDRIEGPEDVRALKREQLTQLCTELREEIVSLVAAKGGHFGGSLGTAELTVALHHVYRSPEDRIVWDVGHQAYGHKVLTGRRNDMPTIRCEGGLSGFLKRTESDHDHFGAGHASTSISAAVGFAEGIKH